ncbi:MAG TPA: PAS domain S-box protein, partial [Abditibacterium sp.]
MHNPLYRVLLVEDNEDDYHFVRDLLKDITTTRYDLTWVDSYAAGREMLVHDQYDVCLLYHRVESTTIVQLMREFGGNETPFILLTTNEDYDVDVEAARAGAADYLVKKHINGPLIERSIRYAIEHKKSRAAILHAQRFAQATVDALPAHVAVIDEQGTIVAVNAAWRRHAAMHGFADANSGIGRNYFEVSENSDAPEGPSAAAGIRAIIDGTKESFHFEYPCHTPLKKQWARIYATRFPGNGPLHVVVAYEDISERKNAEELLRVSEKNLAKAQQMAHLGSWEWDLTDPDDWSKNRVSWSDEAFRIFGYQPGEVEASYDNFMRVMHPDDLAMTNPAAKQAMRGGTPHNVNHRLILPDGTIRVVHEQSEIIMDEDTGQPIKMVGTVQDITEQKCMEETLQKERDFVSAVVDIGGSLILVLDTQGRIIRFNRACETLTDYSFEEVKNQEFWGFFLADEEMEDVKANFHQLRAGHFPLFNENYWLTKDRQRRLIAWSNTALVDAHGVVEYIVATGTDITERKEVEESLRQSNELLRAITEGTSDAIYAKDREGRYLMMNSAGAEIFGTSAHEILGKTDKELVSLELAQEFSKTDRLVMEQGEIYNYEEKPVLKGEKRTYLATKGPLRGPNGEVVGVVGISRDITERTQAENALRESEQRFQSIVANVPGMVYQFVMHPDGNPEMLFVSEGCRDVYEIDPETLRNNPFWIFENVHPDDRNAHNVSLTSSGRTLSPWRHEYRIRLASEKTKWVQGASRPQRLPDGSTLWDGLITDITARKEAEEQRDRFFTMSLDMLGITGFDGYFKRLNPAFSETLGLSQAELMSEPFLNFVHPEDRAESQVIVSKLAEGNSIVGFENRVRSYDGSWRWFEWKSVASVEEKLIYTAARDITERKQWEATLLQMRDDLEERVEARTSELAHSNTNLQLEILERERAEREVRAQARQHEAVADLGRRALLDIDLDTLFQGAVSLVAATLQMGVCSFWERLPGSDTLRLRSMVGLKDGVSIQDKTVGDDTQVGYSALVNTPVVSEDLDVETRFRPAPYMVENGIVSALTASVHGEVVYGVLSACSTQKRKFSQNEIFFLQTIANLLSSAIARKQAEEKIHHLNANLKEVNAELRANEIRLLQGNQLATDLMRLRVRTQGELEEALRQITEGATTIMNIERSSVWLFDGDDT